MLFEVPYIQIDPIVFSDSGKIEALVSALFSIAQEARAIQKTPEAILPEVEKLLRDYKKKRIVRDITDWMISVPRELANLPKAFVEALGKALGENLGKGLTG